MSASPPDKTPTRALDRRALERVLARAAELQAASSDADAPDTIDESRLIAIGEEVGLSATHLRRALAEEGTRVAVADERGFLASVLGVSRVEAQRTVSVLPDDFLPPLLRWMDREEGLVIKRQQPGRTVWEPSTGVIDAVRRAFRFGGRSFALATAVEVAMTIEPVDEQRVLVHFEADLTRSRARAATQAAVAGAAGIGLSGVLWLVVIPAMLPVAVIPSIAAISGAWFVARRAQRQTALRAQLTLEQILDRIERGELARPAGVLGAFSAAASAVVSVTSARPQRRTE